MKQIVGYAIYTLTRFKCISMRWFSKAFLDALGYNRNVIVRDSFDQFIPSSVATLKKIKNPRRATKNPQKTPGQISMQLAYIFGKNPTFPGENPTFPEESAVFEKPQKKP